ncbi:hypothetical protein EJ04DRAFT_506900 [Polyplosphaeria fusca]|uniref:Potassium channel tetramerisation-type BTB domain-containing protein n=1 Tax=Polyplosphaeria fusca TaxID=682080 RepID=A0A9P4QKM6_9PLEO|nr:hypothetical protein EJ04DRAFT_506900 [Polyplosphaeria fusca]
MDPAATMSNTDCSKIIPLNVGGRKMQVAKNTLDLIPVIKMKLKDEWKHDVGTDGHLFLDVDPDIFQHILDRARHPTHFPIFWDKIRGFDYNRYNRLEAQADYLGFSELSEWIGRQEYLKTVQIKMGKPEIHEIGRIGIWDIETVDGNVEVERQVLQKTRSLRVCPRGIAVHVIPADQQKRCGRDCERAKGESGCDYIDETYEVLVTLRKTITLNPEAQG